MKQPAPEDERGHDRDSDQDRHKGHRPGLAWQTQVSGNPQISARQTPDKAGPSLRLDRVPGQGGLQAIERPRPRLNVKCTVEQVEDVSVVDQINASRT
jgi:hypothetical protein